MRIVEVGFVEANFFTRGITIAFKDGKNVDDISRVIANEDKEIIYKREACGNNNIANDGDGSYKLIGLIMLESTNESLYSNDEKQRR